MSLILLASHKNVQTESNKSHKLNVCELPTNDAAESGSRQKWIDWLPTY